MKTLRQSLALILCAALMASAEGNTWKKVRYNGGSVASKVDPKDWNNKLTVTADLISLECKDGAKVGIPPKTVTSLSYGQEAHRRVGTMVALAILVAPVALFGLFHKTRLHYIGIQYTGTDRKKEGILLQGDKDNYRAILVALQSVTGAPVFVSEKEREFIPVGVTANVKKDTEDTRAASDKAATTSSTESQGTVQVNSNPQGAEIFVDQDFVGNTPSSIALPTGKHTISVRKQGWRDWERALVVSGGTVNLNAELVRGTSPPSAESTASARDSAQQTPAAMNLEPRTKTVPRSDGESSSGWIGVATRDNAAKGVVITKVLTGSTAAQAGLQVGDVIAELNGKPVKSALEFDAAIAHSKPGSQIRLSYIRSAWKSEVTVTVGKIGS